MHRFVKGELNWVEPLNQNFEEAAAHAAAQDNPHGVTAEQLGAPTKAYVDAQLSNKADVKPSEWIYPALLNGATSADYSVVRYRKGLNCVYIEGWAKSQVESPIFVLPVGFRPDRNLEFTASQSCDSATHYTARLVVAANGDVLFSRVGHKTFFETGGASATCSFSV